MIYRAAKNIDVSSTDFTPTRACQAILVGTGGTLIVDMATNFPPIKAALLSVNTVDSSGTITGVSIIYGGANYASAPIVTIVNNAGGSGAVITCNLTAGAVSS